jgi:sugar O-acyltransferase (sialic acid O-acetyltransferase NeuD family)
MGVAAKKVGLAGASGFALELAGQAEQSGWQVVAFVDRDDSPALSKQIAGRAVCSLDAFRRHYPDSPLILGLGSGSLRRRIAEQAAATGVRIQGFVHPSCVIDNSACIDPTAVVCAGSIVTSNSKIGAGVLINMGAIVAHDCILADFVTVAPRVAICGHVHIRSGATIGCGALILEGSPGETRVIGENALVGAGACVHKSVEDYARVLPIPPKFISFNNEH